MNPQNPGYPPAGQPAYGQPPAQPAYGQPPTQPGYGAPPPGQPGYGPGYPPPGQPAYGQPPAQPGYGAPPQQPAYAPPPASPGYGAPPQQPPYGQPQGAYVPPGGSAPGYAPPGYGPPQQPQYGQQSGGTPFRPTVPNLDSQNDPDMPVGPGDKADYIARATGQCAIVADGKLLTVEFEVERCADPQLVGRKGVWKCWLVREGIPGKGGDQVASDEIGRFVVPMSGRTKEMVDPATALQMVSEFVQRFTIDGQPMAGRRIGMHVEVEPPRQRKKGAPGQMTKPYTRVDLHILQPGV